MLDKFEKNRVSSRENRFFGSATKEKTPVKSRHFFTFWKKYKYFRIFRFSETKYLSNSVAIFNRILKKVFSIQKKGVFHGLRLFVEKSQNIEKMIKV